MVKLLNWVDKNIFSLFCNIFSASKSERPPLIEKILIVKLWAIGDSVTMLPMIESLRKKYPMAQIDILCHERNKSVFTGIKFIDNIHTLSFGKVLGMIGKYDLAIDAEPFLNVSAVISWISAKHTLGFSHAKRSNLYNEKIIYDKRQHIVQTYLDFTRKLGVNNNPSKLVPLHISTDVSQSVKNKIKDMELEPNDFVVCMTPGVAESVKERMWPPERYAELADFLIERANMKVVFIDSPSNKKTINYIISKMRNRPLVVTSFSLKQSAEFIRCCDLMIANDSGMMHVAAAMGTRTIGLFGVNTPTIWAPYGKENVSIFKPKKGCPYLDNINRKLIPKKLTIDQLTCMDAITVKDVVDEI